jgi:thioredoxin-like negative regulator of GroEL
MKTAKYFSATWCGPCKAFRPIVEELKSEGYNIDIIDIDAQTALAEAYGVRSVPTTVIEQNGNEVERFVGAKPKSYLMEQLNG